MPTNEIQLTAVEWLYKMLWKKHDFLIPRNVYEEAKEIEKKQIIDAYSNNGWNDEDQRANAEQYYNEQFKQDNL
jgi:hypothetical protein